MAIQKTITTNRFGATFTLPDAYCFAQSIKVEQVDAHDGQGEDGLPKFRRKWMITFLMLCYASAAAKASNGEPFHVVPFVAEVPEGNTLTPNALAYAIAKESPDFSGAVDV